MTVYTHTARFDTARALTEDEMRKAAPSIFATAAHASRSERFQPIPTIEILRGLMAEGFMPVGAKQSGTRDAGKADFTKHLIRLRRVDNGRVYSVGDTVCEILLKNANDGTSAYDLMAGLFRIRCLNSLVAQTGSPDVVWRWTRKASSEPETNTVAMRWKRTVPVYSPSGTSAPARSNVSPPLSAKALRSWPRCTPISRG